MDGNFIDVDVSFDIVDLNVDQPMDFGDPIDKRDNKASIEISIIDVEDKEPTLLW